MKKIDQTGFSIIEALLFLVIIGILGFTSWYVYHAKQASNKDYSTVSNATAPTYNKTTNTTTSDSYAGWKTYTSSFEKLSFKYPSTWKSVTPALSSTDPSADSFELKSPSGALAVSWLAEVDGIGGACDNTVMPTANNGACPYWYVQDKQKLSGADLYYVDGVVTHDGNTFSPWCALQGSDGILKNEGDIGYLLFMGKNNGQADAGLLCGEPFDGIGLTKGTKAQAMAALSSAEFKQAKQILLSAAY